MRRLLLAVLLVLAVDAHAAPGPDPTTAAPASTDEVAETPRTLPSEDAVMRTLASPRYRFCFEPRYPLWEEEVRWCALLPRSPDPRATRCPSFAAACRAGVTAQLAPRREPLHVKLPDFGGLGRVVLWGLSALALGGLVVLLVRAAWRGKSDGDARRDGRREAAPGGPATPDAAHAAVIERDVERLMARARAAAAAGDFLSAVTDLRAALLRRLEGDGHVRIHPAATSGDYVRELRRRAPGLAAPVDGVVRDVERVEFGDGRSAETTYQSVLGRLGPLLAQSAGKLAALVLAAVVGSSCQPPGRPDWASSPSGSAAVAQFLTAVGIGARERLHPLKDLARESGADGPNQVLVLPDAAMGDAEWTALRDWLTDGNHTLVVAAGTMRLPPWLAHLEAVPTGAPEEVRVGEELATALDEDADEDEEEDDDPHAAAARTALHAHLLGLRGRLPGGAWLRTGVEQSTALLLRGGRPYALSTHPHDAIPGMVMGRSNALARGNVVVLGDERLLTNAALVVADNAEILETLLRLGGGPVEIINAETGLVSPNPVAAVTRGRLAPFLLQLGACLILFLLLRGRAFGRLVDRDVVARRAFSEHVRALGTQYARGRAATHVLGSYAAWATERLRERIRLSGEGGIGDLAGAVAARTGRPLGDVARVLFAARRPGDPEEGGREDRSRAGAQHQLTMMRDLAQLLTASRATSGRPSRVAAAGPSTQKGTSTP